MSDSTKDSKASMDRRDFLLATTVAAGATLGLGVNPIRAASLASNEVRVGIIGAGAQGQVLLDAALQIPNLRFTAVCDIWTEYNQRRVSRLLVRSCPKCRYHGDMDTRPTTHAVQALSDANTLCGVPKKKGVAIETVPAGGIGLGEITCPKCHSMVNWSQVEG
jgi:hypothetical protein